MPNSSRTAAAPPKSTGKKSAPKPSATRRKKTPAKRSKPSATTVAITTELAPAVAIALLGKADHGPGDPPPALDCLAAGATPSDTPGKVRVQLMFENGAVLPVEMTADAGEALSKGLTKELPKA